MVLLTAKDVFEAKKEEIRKFILDRIDSNNIGYVKILDDNVELKFMDKDLKSVDSIDIGDFKMDDLKLFGVFITHLTAKAIELSLDVDENEILVDNSYLSMQANFKIPGWHIDIFLFINPIKEEKED